MKKFLLASLYACLLTQAHGALSRLQTIAGLSVSLKKTASCPFTTTSPLKIVLADTIWQTPKGTFVRTMGDMHVPSDKPYFESVRGFLKEADRTPNHTTSVLIEGAFDDEKMKVSFNENGKSAEKKLVLARLNLLPLTEGPFKRLTLDFTTSRTNEFRKLMRLFLTKPFQAFLEGSSPFSSLITPEDINFYVIFFECFNPQAIKKTEEYFSNLAIQLKMFMNQENNSAFTPLFSTCLTQIDQFLFILNKFEKIDTTQLERAFRICFSTRNNTSYTYLKKAFEKTFLTDDLANYAHIVLYAGPSSLTRLLEDTEIIMHTVNTVKKNHNLVVYAGLGHTIGISPLLKSIGLTTINHTGATKFDITDINLLSSPGLNHTTLESNNMLFLHLLRQLAQ